jgi:hypothetical protein
MSMWISLTLVLEPVRWVLEAEPTARGRAGTCARPLDPEGSPRSDWPTDESLIEPD